MEFAYERHRIDKIPKREVLAELERVAELRGYVEFGRRDFNQMATISAATVMRAFDGWSNAIAALRRTLASRGIELKDRSKRQYAELELFAEMERIWRELGHRPSRIEWRASKPQISNATYVRYFGGWPQACLRFLEHRSSSSKVGQAPATAHAPRAVVKTKRNAPAVEAGRDVPAGLRLRVYEKDRFRCVYCGRTPITELSVELHVDHIAPFSRGGKTTLENLQTLCSVCNLGKGARADVAHVGV
jgi:hypothetical protein